MSENKLPFDTSKPETLIAAMLTNAFLVLRPDLAEQKLSYEQAEKITLEVFEHFAELAGAPTNP